MLQHGHYNPATTNLLRRVTTIRPLQTRHNPATTISPQPPGHYEFATTMVTTNSLQRWSLRIRYNDGHYKLLQYGHYNPVTTNSPQPGHYDLATTRSLRIHYNPVTTN